MVYTNEERAGIKLRKARVTLQEENPFFSYLAMLLELRANKEAARGTLGVSNDGVLVYDPDYVNELDQNTIKSALCHEIMHLALEHVNKARQGSRDKQTWNIAGDLVINDFLRGYGFKIPDVITVNGQKIEWIQSKHYELDDCSKKTTEEVYALIYKKKPPGMNKECMTGTEEGRSDGKKTASGSKRAENEINWKEAMVEAAAFAKKRGTLPRGLERFVEEAYIPKVNWVQMLSKYITQELPVDYTWSRPSKRSVSMGIYLPGIKKEMLEVVVAIDTSGSIDDKILSEFLGNVIDIARSFEGLRMDLIVCDTEVQEVLEVANGNIETILQLKPKGGGGTSHIPVFKHIMENKPNARILVALTDGYTEFPKMGDIPSMLRTIWVVPYGNQQEKDFPFGEVIMLE